MRCHQLKKVKRFITKKKYAFFFNRWRMKYLYILSNQSIKIPFFIKKFFGKCDLKLKESINKHSFELNLYVTCII